MERSASVLFKGGTVLALDAAGTRATSIAIRADRVLALGDDSSMARWIGPHTRVIDLAGRAVIPGFNDAHAHMDREGLKQRRVSLAGCRCVEDVLGRIRGAAAAAKPDEWIVTMPVGEPPYYFNGPGAFAERRMPTRGELDAAAPANPVYIQGVFTNWGAPPGYSALNTLALQKNNVTASTRPRIAGVTIEREPGSDQPSGVIVEHNPRPTIEFDFLKAVPRFTYRDRLEGLTESMRRYNAVGTTSVYEGHGLGAATIAAYRELWEKKAISVRSALVLSPAWSDFAECARTLDDWRASASWIGDAWLSVWGVHIAWGGDAQLAALARADLPNTGWAGFVEQAITPGDFRDYCYLFAQHGIRMNTIVSDQLHEVLPILEEVATRYPLAGRRWAIQHIARATRADLVRLAALGVEVTTIPAYFLWKGGHRYLNEPDGGESIVAHRTLAELGVPFATATDNIPYEPFFTLWVIANRIERSSGRVIGPSQRLDNEAALRSLTVAGARLTFDEHVKGPLAPGHLADLAVVSDDPTAVPPERLRDLMVDLTMVGGRIVFERV